MLAQTWSARRHPPVLVYQPLLEGGSNPLTRLPASPGRELRPPALVYQPHLEGSYNPLTEGYNPQHLYGPRFINFHTFASANPSLHTRFPFTDVAYIRASVHINLRILQYKLHCAYMLSLHWSRVYTRFFCGEVAYRSSTIIEQHTSSDQIFSSDLSFYFRQMFASSQI